MYPFQYALWRKRTASTVDGFSAFLLWLKVSPAALKFLSLLLLLAGMLNMLWASLDSNGKMPLLFFHQPKRSRSSSMSWLRQMYWWTSSTVSDCWLFRLKCTSEYCVINMVLTIQPMIRSKCSNHVWSLISDPYDFIHNTSIKFKYRN